MYIYDETELRLAGQRVAQFKDQTQRFLAGQLSEEEYRPLRLRNGLYLRRHAPMLRVAIPYGMLSARQLRTLARIARRWDKGYAHLGTRQNIQFNWPRLEDVPQILAELAGVQMHAIQAGGNCIRNTASDHFAGLAPDELVNPLLWCEMIRQWSALHPESDHLPRKVKIDVSGAPADRIAAGVHDIGLQAVQQDGVSGFLVRVGKPIAPFIAWPDLLTYMEAMLRVYQLHGRRDSKYKARIKILVNDLTPAAFAREVALQWTDIRGGPGTLSPTDVEAVAARFTWPAYRAPADARRDERTLAAHAAANADFARWLQRNVHPHRAPGYAAVTVSLKAAGIAPGDIGADQMDAVADLAETYSFGELRVSHQQNLILADVRRAELHALWQQLDLLRLA